MALGAHQPRGPGDGDDGERGHDSGGAAGEGPQSRHLPGAEEGAREAQGARGGEH